MKGEIEENKLRTQHPNLAPCRLTLRSKILLNTFNWKLRYHKLFIKTSVIAKKENKTIDKYARDQLLRASMSVALTTKGRDFKGWSCLLKITTTSKQGLDPIGKYSEDYPLQDFTCEDLKKSDGKNRLLHYLQEPI